MSRKVFAVITVLLTIFTLSGCQLAREDGEANKSIDKLVGVYVSYEYADLFNFEGYNEGRMYALQKDEVRTSSEGEKYSETQFVFEGLPGIGMFAPTVADPLSEDMTYISAAGNGFSDTKLHIISGDNEDGLELAGTVYISSGAMSDIIYINPVFQSEDGKVYLVSGQGFSAGDNNGEGEIYSQKLENKATVTENGKSKSYNSTIEISLAIMYPPVKVSILQMDKDSNIIKKAEYDPDNVPSELKTESGTEYIIVESTKETYNKELKIERTLFSKSDEALWHFKKSGDKVFIKAYIAVIWE